MTRLIAPDRVRRARDVNVRTEAYTTHKVVGALASQSFSRAEFLKELERSHLAIEHAAVQPLGDIACPLLHEGRLTPFGRGVPSPGMAHGRKNLSRPRETPKKGPHLGLVIALAAAGGVIIGSAGTYFFSKPQAAPKQSTSPAAGGTPQAQTISLPPKQQFTPAPQPPGAPPPGKVWSVEHGHWHDVPGALKIPAPATAMPAPATVIPSPGTTPATTTTPAPAAVPEEKKE
jgi:hypothetical protein